MYGKCTKYNLCEFYILYTANVPFTKADLLSAVPSFREISPEKRNLLFIRKLRLCSVIFDFQNESTQENLGKEMKRQILLELVDYITTSKGWFNEFILQEILSMISANLFRSLSPSIYDGLSSRMGFDPEEDEPTLDLNWPHLQIVYEFLLRFIVSIEPDPKLLKRKLSGPFLLSLLTIFRSEDPREREYLKTILHRIYGKFMSLRSFIRKSINNVFYCIIYENEKHNGIAELLEILGSIINGFALPLKLEHKKFLNNILLPLHKTSRLQIYHQQLSYCITQFIEKDSSLSFIIINGILKYWPLTSSSKEVLLLNELEEILEITPIAILKIYISYIFKRLCKCVRNEHFQVSERALFYWNNDLITSLTKDYKNIILPIIIPELYAIEKKHWNSTVHSLTVNVIRIIKEIDSELYSKIYKKLLDEENGSTEFCVIKKREENWNKLQLIAYKNRDLYFIGR